MAELPLAERIAILKDNEGWFGRAPAAYQDAVLARCDWRHYAAGTPIYRAVDEHADMVGIVDGTVEFYSRFGTGDNPLLHLAHEGHWLGTASVLAQGPPRVTALARVDTLVARISFGALNEVLAARPEWWRVQGTAGLEYGDMGVSAFVDSLISDNERRFACTLLRIAGLRAPRRSRPEGAPGAHHAGRAGRDGQRVADHPARDPATAGAPGRAGAGLPDAAGAGRARPRDDRGPASGAARRGCADLTLPARPPKLRGLRTGG